MSLKKNVKYIKAESSQPLLTPQLPQYAKFTNPDCIKSTRVFEIRANTETLFTHTRRMAKEDENTASPQPSKLGPSPNSAQKSPSLLQPTPPSEEPRNGSSSHIGNNSPLPSRNVQSGEEFISSVAAKIAAQPLHYSDPDVWGVLTAISEKARKRHQVYQRPNFFFCFFVSLEMLRQLKFVIVGILLVPRVNCFTFFIYFVSASRNCGLNLEEYFQFNMNCLFFNF